MLYTERYTYYYASLKIACQMELRKAGQTVGKIWLSIGLSGLVIGYIYNVNKYVCTAERKYSCVFMDTTHECNALYMYEKLCLELCR